MVRRGEEGQKSKALLQHWSRGSLSGSMLSGVFPIYSSGKLDMKLLGSPPRLLNFSCPPSSFSLPFFAFFPGIRHATQNRTGVRETGMKYAWARSHPAVRRVPVTFQQRLNGCLRSVERIDQRYKRTGQGDRGRGGKTTTQVCFFSPHRKSMQGR